MVAFTFLENFSSDLANGIHNFGADVFKFYLSNDPPNVATDEVRADIVEIGAGNGYTTGGNVTTITLNRVGDTTTVLGSDPTVWTATGGTIGPFRYSVLYNDTPTSPTDPVVGYYDYGSSVTLQVGETFTIDLDAVNGILDINPG